MEHSKYIELKRDLENYYAKIIQKRFKDYVDENFEIHFFAIYEDHLKISKLLLSLIMIILNLKNL